MTARSDGYEEDRNIGAPRDLVARLNSIEAKLDQLLAFFAETERQFGEAVEALRGQVRSFAESRPELLALLPPDMARTVLGDEPYVPSLNEG